MLYHSDFTVKKLVALVHKLGRVCPQTDVHPGAPDQQLWSWADVNAGAHGQLWPRTDAHACELGQELWLVWSGQRGGRVQFMMTHRLCCDARE
jgi:hypothetical protein